MVSCKVMTASPLQVFAEDVFVVDGPTVRAFGFPFSTRMIIVKLAGGSLWINSPVSAAPEVRATITSMGPVRYLVAPTKLHVWRLREWHALFPKAELWRPPQIPDDCKSLPFAGTLEDAPPAAWSHDLDQMVFRGNLFIEEIYFLHRSSGTVILADFIQNHRVAEDRTFRHALCRLAGVAYPDGGVPLDVRLSFLDRRVARESLQKLLSWDFDRLILAHGVCVEKNAKKFVKKAFAWLLN